jgi:hypothetical protein
MSDYSIEDRTTQLPAGTYYIGDPCYVIPDEQWMEAREETLYFGLFPDPAEMNKGEHNYNPKHLMNGVFRYKEWLFAVSSTDFGDGCYPCIDCTTGAVLGKCGVDAGMIGAIPIEMVMDFDEDAGLGVEHIFKQSFRLDYVDGTICFGNVEVITGDDYDEPPFEED